MLATTDPASPDWAATDPRFRRTESSSVIGHGEADWARVRRAVLHWEVKTRSGFRVRPAGPVRAGARPTITVDPPLLRIREPVEVVDVVDTAERAGFAYRTLPGHPVDGEEAFIAHREGDAVLLTIRSLTRASTQQPWRTFWPLLLVVQAAVHRRYLRALR